jgi:hypothetical protein
VRLCLAGAEPRRQGPDVAENFVHRASRGQWNLLDGEGCPADLDDDLWAGRIREKFVLEQSTSSIDLVESSRVVYVEIPVARR